MLLALQAAKEGKGVIDWRGRSTQNLELGHLQYEPVIARNAVTMKGRLVVIVISEERPKFRYLLRG
jgi:hypothetical protein